MSIYLRPYNPADDYKFEYDISCFDEDGFEIHNYYIEADCDEDAINCAREFCHDDYPFKRIGEVIINEMEEIEYVQNG